MMVTFVSQCQKKALNRTRRVLDAFADRIGDNTWQTVITQEGLLAVKKLLRKTATKNTAVSCHWIRSRARSELVWVVGSRQKFNAQGVVPTNRTALDLSHREWEQGWLLNEMIVLAASIAGLFHDFGKANDLFQNKLKGKTELKKEPYRHEWVSLRLFEAFVNGQEDTVWLLKLKELDQGDNAAKAENAVKKQLYVDSAQGSKPLLALFAPFAQLVAWLIVSHHRLPVSHVKKVEAKDMATWLANADCHWNSANARDLSEYSKAAIASNWRFTEGTPLLSKPWQKRACRLATRALNYPDLKANQNWLGQRFVAHLSRLSLMLADHYYSSLAADKSKPSWRDSDYSAYANTDKSASNATSASLKQQLDEHNIGVAVNAQRFAQNLPALKGTLPSIGLNSALSKNSSHTQYLWQNTAYKCAKAIAQVSERQGFFGVNMASTGCGKTIANARIMYALADESEGCRFSVALGLRALTLQTGDAYRDLLKLGDDELAVLVGSSAVKTLHELNQSQPVEPSVGSESSESLMDKLYVSYEGQIYDGRLKHWLEPNPKLEKLISAPILVSTIDHLMPATESQRGGKQIAPMLRLLSADLVLDEPDDFGLEDLPALCRLVNWAGMLGSRVLLSSATLPPALISTLFEAYAEGRRHFNEANYPSPSLKQINCAWFDEFNSETLEITESSGLSSKQAYLKYHKGFVEKRVAKLKQQTKTLRKGKIIPVDTLEGKNINDVYQSVAAALHKGIHQLHDLHHVKAPNGRKVSVGVVRLANINPLVSIAKLLVNMPPTSDYSFHFCVYHSQFPMALRSYKEACLDETLKRHDPKAIFQQSDIVAALKTTKTKNNVFIVLGTSVVEVGRDHDYDWALAEPSSLRALIQLAGRVQRHRQREPKNENIWVLNNNIRALRGDDVAYCKPGFESKAIPLQCKDMTTLLSGQLENISAIPRVSEPKLLKDHFEVDKSKPRLAAKAVADFAVQEHRALRFSLNICRGDEYYRSGIEACLWWHEQATWSGEFIKQTEFRKSQPQETFILRKVEDEDLKWSQFADNGDCIEVEQSRFQLDTLNLADGCHWWLNHTVEEVYESFVEKTGWSITRVSERFGETNLRAPSKDKDLIWSWHEQLGAYENTTTPEVTWKN